MDSQSTETSVPKKTTKMAACPFLRPSKFQCQHCLIQTCHEINTEFIDFIPILPKKTIPNCPICKKNDQVLALAYSWYEKKLAITIGHNYLCLKCEISF